MSAVGRVLIVGGGIGGLSTAIALARAGIHCTIAEIETHWSVYGVGIIQPANALRAYAQIGIVDRCLTRGFLYQRQRLYDVEGKQIGERALPRMEGMPFYGNCGIARPILNDILVGEATSLGVDIRLGTTLVHFEDRGPHVDVELSDGMRERFDLVIGADGLYSPLRAKLFPDAPRPVFSGQGCWRVTFEKPAEMQWSSAFYGPNRAGLIPLSQTSMYMFVTTSEPGNPRMPRDELPALLHARLAAYSGQVAALRDSVRDPDAIVYKPLEYLLVPAPWHRGRVVLIGDAVHSTTPHHAQGAAMAVEDAVVLGELLARDGNVPDLLDEFMRRRFDRCRFVVDSSIAVSELEQSGADHAAEEAIAISERVRHGLLAPA